MSNRKNDLILNWEELTLTWIATKCDSKLDSNIKILINVKKVCKKLLMIDEQQVCVMKPDYPMNKGIVNLGKLCSSNRVILKKKEDNQCHFNTALMWKSNPDKYSFVTGYAFTEDDQIWRRHSWILDDSDSIIETTLIRDKYFGMIYPKEYSDDFVKLYN